MICPIVLPGLAIGSAIALGLWLFFKLVPRVTPDVRAWSWRMVILKLAISAFAVGQVSLHLLPTIAPATQPTVLSSTPILHPVVHLPSTPIAAHPPAPIQKPAEPSMRGAELIGIAIWGAGMMILCLQAIFVAIRTRRALRDVVPVTDPEVVEYLEALAGGSGLTRPPRLVCLDSAPGPMVCGIWRSIIVLPGRLASGPSQDVELALGHEIAHIRRRDLTWAAIAWVVRCVLFFNPVVWLAESELRAAQESATDQEAVWLTGASVAAYGKMLLTAMSPDRAALQPGLAMFDSFRNAHRRLRAMKHFSERPRPTRKVTLATLVGVGIACLPSYLLVPASAAAKLHPQNEEGPKVLTNASAPKSEEMHGVTRAPTPVRHQEPKFVAVPAKGLPTTPIVPEPPKANLPEEKPPQTKPSKPQPSQIEPAIQFVEEQANSDTGDAPQSPELNEATTKAQEEFNATVSKLIADEVDRIAAYRRGADQRESEAEQREREAQQRKREGIQRARAALLAEEVIEEREKNNYEFDQPGQRERDARERAASKRQREADAYQLVLDQKQRETDAWQRTFDENSVSAMKDETKRDISVARSKYQERVAELMADDSSRRREANGAAAYTQRGLHYVNAGSGLSFAIPNGYKIVRVQPNGKDSYTVVLSHIKN